MFDSYSTEAMFRVARIVTPSDEASRWISTAWDRCWYRNDSGDWVSVAPEKHNGGHRYDDTEMREHLAEQLEAYGVPPVNAIWKMH